MAEATPAAEELAKEKGIDLDSVQGSGKDGRVLMEDVEAALEENSEAPEDVGELTEPEQSERSVEAYDEHPHVQDEPNVELEQADVEEAAVEAADEEEDSDDEDSEDEDVEDEDRELLSQDSILSRGERERGFYVIPEQTNPNAPHPNAEPDKEAEEAAARAAGESDVEDEDTPVRPAEQEGVVDTSSGGEAPSHGESLKDKAPAVADVAEKGGAGTYEAGAGGDRIYPAEEFEEKESKDDDSDDS